MIRSSLDSAHDIYLVYSQFYAVRFDRVGRNIFCQREQTFNRVEKNGVLIDFIFFEKIVSSSLQLKEHFLFCSKKEKRFKRLLFKKKSHLHFSSFPAFPFRDLFDIEFSDDSRALEAPAGVSVRALLYTNLDA